MSKIEIESKSQRNETTGTANVELCLNMSKIEIESKSQQNTTRSRLLPCCV